MDISERIHTLRLHHQLSKAELARRVGVSDVAVHWWETGATKQIGHPNIVALCRTLGCSADMLLGLAPFDLPAHEGR